MHIYRDPGEEEQDIRLLCSAKANYLRRQPRTLRFSIMSWDLLQNEPCHCSTDMCPHEGRVVWGDGEALYDGRSAEAIWEALQNRGKRRDVNVQEAETFLRRVLAQGEMSFDLIVEYSKAERISMASLRRAKKNLNVVSVMSKGFPSMVTGWVLPGGKPRLF